MKKVNRLIVYVMAMLIAVTLCAVSAQAATKTVSLNKKSITVYANGKTTLKASGIKKGLKWSSSNKSVATVDQKGVISAKKAGKAVITVKAGTKKATCKVVVKKAFSTAKILAKVNKEIKTTNYRTLSLYSKSVSEKNIILKIGLNVKKNLVYMENKLSDTGCDKMYTVAKKVYWHSTSDNKWYYYNDDGSTIITINDESIDVKSAKAKGYKYFGKTYCRVLSVKVDSETVDLYVNAADYSVVGLCSDGVYIKYDLHTKIELPSAAKKAKYKKMGM